MASLRDIAEACGVSIATVSIALRGAGHVAPGTLAKVRAAAERLGYTPDPMAARLSSRRFSQASTRAGLALAIASHTALPPEALVPAYLQERARELGYRCTTEKLPENPTRLGSMLGRWHRQGVAGVVFHRLKHDLATGLDGWRRFSLVNCASNETLAPCHTVMIDAGEAVLECVSRLRAKGYRAIGMAILRHPVEVKDDRDRLAAALLAHAKAAPGERRVPVFAEPLRAPETPGRFQAWFATHRPDAIVGLNAVVLHWLEQGGWNSPRDCAFASLNYARPRPEIAGYGGAERKCGYAAVELLDQLIRHRETGWPEVPRRTLLPSRWIEGASAPETRIASPSTG